MSNPSSFQDSQHAYSIPLKAVHHTDIEGGELRTHTETAVLQVIDAPFDGSLPKNRAIFCLGDDIATGMRQLPPHEAGTARILDVTVHSNFVITGLRDPKGPKTTRTAREVLIQFLQETYTQTFEERRIFRWLNDPVLVNDIGSISAQWTQQLGSGTSGLYRLVNRTSLQQDPLDHDLRPRDSYLTCAQDDQKKRLLAIIVHDVWSTQTFNVSESGKGGITFHNPRIISEMRDGTSWTSRSDGSLETFAKLLVLDFFLSSIYLQRTDYYGSLIYPQLPELKKIKFSLTKNPHLQVPLGLFEPRMSAKSDEAFREIEDAEGILRSVNNLVDSINWVIDALQLERTDALPSTDYGLRMQRLKGLIRERCTNADRALNALNRQLDYLTKRHAIRESKSIRTLTILASLYLPLSLAASLLGMQSPLKLIAHNKTENENEPDLLETNLLFDFFGVFVVLAAGTIFIVHGIRFGLWLKVNGLGIIWKYFEKPYSILSYGKRWRYEGTGGKIFEIVRVFTAWWIGAGLCVVLLVIFLMGMLKTSQVAWDTARILFAVYITGSGLLIIAYFGIFSFLHRRNVRNS